MFSIPSPPAKIILDLIRHGEPEGGVKYRGSLDDPLSKTGWQQMFEATDNARQQGIQWDSIITSPMQRCHHFAEQLAAQLDISCTQAEALREISFGDLEGLTPSTAWQLHGKLLKDLWNKPEHITPPNGEPYPEFRERVKTGLTEILNNHRDQTILLVIHGGTIRVLLHLLLHFQPRDTFSIEIPYGGMSRLTVYFDAQHKTDNIQTASLNFLNRFVGSP